MDREAWQATLPKSRTRLSDFPFHPYLLPSGSRPSPSFRSEAGRDDSARITRTVIVSVADPQREAAVQVRLWQRPRHRLGAEHPGQRRAVALCVPGGERELRQAGSGSGPHRLGHSPRDTENPQPRQPCVFWGPRPPAGLAAGTEPPGGQWFPGLHGLHLPERAGAAVKQQTQELRAHRGVGGCVSRVLADGDGGLLEQPLPERGRLPPIPDRR